MLLRKLRLLMTKNHKHVLLYRLTKAGLYLPCLDTLHAFELVLRGPY